MLSLDEFLTTSLYAGLVVFARLGAVILLMPGIGDPQVMVRVRVIFALLLTVLITPIVASTLPPRPNNVLDLGVLLGQEVIIGLFFGTLMRFLLTALDIAGHMISHFGSLNAAQVFNPTIGGQGSLVGAFLGTLGVLLIFATNMHHMLIQGIIDSYTLFTPGAPIPTGDMAMVVSDFLAESFRLGVQIAGPFIIVGMVFYIGMGILARLMPQMPVFFVLIPAKFLITFIIMALVLSAMMMLFLDRFESRIEDFLAPA
jgi:flagellar biosynthetic protein FliR